MISLRFSERGVRLKINRKAHHWWCGGSGYCELYDLLPSICLHRCPVFLQYLPSICLHRWPAALYLYTLIILLCKSQLIFAWSHSHCPVVYATLYFTALISLLSTRQVYHVCTCLDIIVYSILHSLTLPTTFHCKCCCTSVYFDLPLSNVRPFLLPVHLTGTGFRDEVIETLAAACSPPINQTNKNINQTTANKNINQTNKLNCSLGQSRDNRDNSWSCNFISFIINPAPSATQLINTATYQTIWPGLTNFGLLTYLVSFWN